MYKGWYMCQLDISQLLGISSPTDSFSGGLRLNKKTSKQETHPNDNLLIDPAMTAKKYHGGYKGQEPRLNLAESQRARAIFQVV